MGSMVCLIADSWPQSLDDGTARRDWNWKHDYDLQRTTELMLRLISDQKKSLQQATAAVQQQQQHLDNLNSDTAMAGGGQF